MYVMKEFIVISLEKLGIVVTSQCGGSFFLNMAQKV